ncbi:MAG: ABC transporter permease subunit [Planctomycetota bacterium]
MWSYVLRRCLLMVPTFVGITALAFTVMQVAGEHAYEKELMLLTGAGKAGEGSAGSSSKGPGLSALSLEQYDRIRARYELDIPIIVNTSPLDRSDMIVKALDDAVAPMPAVEFSGMHQVLNHPSHKPLQDVLAHYESEAGIPKAHWNLEDALINSVGARMVGLEGAAGIESSWNKLRAPLESRKLWRQKRERAGRTLEMMGARLIPVLASGGAQLDAPQRDLALATLNKLGLLEDVATWEDFGKFWQKHQEEFDADWLMAGMEEWLEWGEDTEESLALEDGLFKWTSCAAESAYQILIQEPDPEFQVRALRAFERTTGCDSIPFVADPSDDRSVALAVTEAKKWWRTHELEFVEIGPMRRVWSTLRETRYGRWLSDILHLDFRESRTQGKPVLTAIAERLPISVQFGLIGFLLSYLVCIPLGVAKAVRHGTSFDFISSALVFVGYSIPGWAFGFILLVVFGGGTFPTLAWFPLQGFQSDNYETLDFWGKVLDRAHHAALPVMAYSIGSFATLTVLMKNSLLENLGSDYVRTAFAKGLSEKRVIFIHTLRNSLIPLCTMLGHILSFALAGSYLVESVFNINGFGLLGFKAIQDYDINLMMGSLVIGAILQLTGNLFSDLLYSAVDPRIRFS